LEGAPLRAMPRHSITWQGWRIGQWPSRGHASVVPRLCSRACGARPSTGGKPRWEALRGKPRDGEKGSFLGGARSPRPRGKALLMPGHFITRGEWPGGRGLMETCLGQAQAFFNGRAEPAPPRGGPSKLGWPCGGNPGDNVEGGFLGGARFLRPQVRAGRKPGHVMIAGRGEGWFLRRGALCAPECLGRTQAPLWHGGREVDEGPVAYRGNAQVEPMVSSRACRARPSAGWTIQAGMTLRGKARG